MHALCKSGVLRIPAGCVNFFRKKCGKNLQGQKFSLPLHSQSGSRMAIAEIAQLVEHNLAKVGVASSSLVFRSEIKRTVRKAVLFGFQENETRTSGPEASFSGICAVRRRRQEGASLGECSPPRGAAANCRQCRVLPEVATPRSVEAADCLPYRLLPERIRSVKPSRHCRRAVGTCLRLSAARSPQRERAVRRKFRRITCCSAVGRSGTT